MIQRGRENLEVVVLGAAGWVPQRGMLTTSIAVRLPETLILFDAGTGLARLLEPTWRRLIPEKRTIHLFLTHFHLDHTVGLSFVSALFRNPLVVYVPGEGITGFPVTVLDRLIGPPFFPHTLDRLAPPVRVESIDPGDYRHVDLGPLSLRVRAQNHPGGSLGYRLGDALGLLTDTVFEPEAAEFVRGVRLLIHEAWIRGEGDSEELRAGLSAHTSAEEAARLAQAGEVGELVLIHLTPLRGEDFHAEMLERARKYFPRTYLAYDGLTRLL